MLSFSGMLYLHNCGILHKNLNVNSIVLDHQLNPKITSSIFF